MSIATVCYTQQGLGLQEKKKKSFFFVVSYLVKCLDAHFYQSVLLKKEIAFSQWLTKVNLFVFVFSHSGFLDKNNDLLFRNLKEVGGSLWKTWCFLLWVQMLINVFSVRLQVMCMSENKILTQCFDREELSDKKRPDTVRYLPEYSVCVCAHARVRQPSVQVFYILINHGPIPAYFLTEKQTAVCFPSSVLSGQPDGDSLQLPTHWEMPWHLFALHTHTLAHAGTGYCHRLARVLHTGSSVRPLQDCQSHQPLLCLRSSS